MSVGSSGASSRARAPRAELLAELERQDALIATLQASNADLGQRISLLEARLDKNSQNSSKPPEFGCVRQTATAFAASQLRAQAG